jgi:hypothetical protein
MPRDETTAVQGRLNVHAMDDSTRIEILDGNLRSIKLDQNLGEVAVELPMGVYVIRFHQGGRFAEKLAALTPSSPVVNLWLPDQEQPQFATAVPLLNTATTHEWQSGPAQQLSRSQPLPPPSGHQGGSHLLLFLRDPFRSSDLPGGITLHDAFGQKLFDLAAATDRNQQDHWAGAHLSLDPGTYRLRRALAKGAFVEQIVYTRQAWQTQIFLMTAEGNWDVLRTSILMARPELGFDFTRDDLRWTESALRALGGKRNIPGSVRSQMLWAKFDNPMLGIYSALLHLRRQQIDAVLMREVFGNLYNLVGALPDVLAIGWGAALRDEATRAEVEIMEKLRQPDACATPPMLAESWKHLAHASISEHGLIPAGSLSDLIGGRLTAGSPWVTWLGNLPAPETLPKFSGESVAVPSVSLASISQKTLADASGIETAGEIWPKMFGSVYDAAMGYLEGAKNKTLGVGLPALAEMLVKYPDTKFWLRTQRFSNLERRMAYWLQPVLDPRLGNVVKGDAKFKSKLEKASKERAADEATLLRDLDMTSTTALRVAWGVFTKLFVFPVLPGQPLIDGFVKEESRGSDAFAKVLLLLRQKSSQLNHPPSGRTLNLLEFAFLYYRGSPADSPTRPKSPDQLAFRLGEAEFVFGSEKDSVSSLNLTLQHVQLRQDVISALESPAGIALRLPEMWQLRVFPTLEQYTRGNLFPN